MSVGVIVGGTLATFSKENGILLPAYILVLEITLLRGLTKPPLWRPWCALCLYLPLLILAGFLLFNFNSAVLGSYGSRDFSLTQRLLTETRVLWDYLDKLLMPEPGAYGLFYDGYPLSKTIIDPPQTLLACLSLLALLSFALWARTRAPVFAFGVLWFFTGHVLESTFIGLEIYFEHRNYLPSAGIIFATVFYLLYLLAYIKHKFLKGVILIPLLGWVILFPLTTLGETDLWGQPGYQALAWMEENPKSRRAPTACRQHLSTSAKTCQGGGNSEKYPAGLAERQRFTCATAVDGLYRPRPGYQSIPRNPGSLAIQRF